MAGGKISPSKFKDFFGGSFGRSSSNIIAGPAFGVDTALVAIDGGLAMAMASDPLSYIPGLGAEKSAWLSVHLTANDVATSGVMPQYFQMVLNMPDYLSEEEFRDYWQHLHSFCEDAAIAITGGHTAFVPGQNSTISGGGTMVAISKRENFLTSQMARPGDVLLMTKQAAISAVAILGLNFPKKMIEIFGETKRDYFERLFYQISIMPEAKIAAQLNKEKQIIHAMHDVTEGGVLGAAYEFCTAAGLGIEVDLGKIKTNEISAEVCRAFSLPPERIIGAGSLLMAVDPNFADQIIEHFNKENIDVTEIGRFLSDSEAKIIFDNDGRYPLVYLEEDPYWEAFSKAIGDE